MIIERDPVSQSIHVPKTPKSASTISFPDPCTPTKSRNVSTFNLLVIKDSPKSRGSSKRPVADSPSSFGVLFSSRKSAKVDPLDNDLLRPMMEKVDALTPRSKEQSEHIKRLKDKIDQLTQRNNKMKFSPSTTSQPKMASRVSAFVNSNFASGLPSTLSVSIPTIFKPT